jgi:superoxide dismutase
LNSETKPSKLNRYYLNYQNKRADYVVDFLGSLVNWDFVNEQFAAVWA